MPARLLYLPRSSVALRVFFAAAARLANWASWIVTTLHYPFRIDCIEDVVSEISGLFGLKVRTLPGGLVLLG